MAKRGRRAAAFSVESLRDEVDQEVAQQQIGQKIEADVAKLDLRFPEGLPENVVLWALLLKFGLAVVSSVAGIIKDLSVLPSNSRLQVFRIIYPTISDDDGAILFNCMRRISEDKLPTPCQGDKVCVLSPPKDRCFTCNFHLVAYNSPVKVEYFDSLGTFPAVKVSFKCNR